MGNKNKGNQTSAAPQDETASIADSTLTGLDSTAAQDPIDPPLNADSASSDPIDPPIAEQGPLDPPASSTDSVPDSETIADLAPATPAAPVAVEAKTIVPDPNSSPLPGSTAADAAAPVVAVADPVVIAAPAPVAAPAPSPLAPVSTTKVVEADSPATGVVKQIIDDVSAKVGNTARFNLRTIGDYMENMKPRKVMTAVDGARHQVALYRALTNIINNLEEDFAPAFTTVLRLFDEHREGVFHESHVFRFFETMSLPEADRKAFQRLLNLIKLLAPVKGRKVAMGQVDFDRSLEHGITEAGRQRVAAYFNR